MKYKALILGLLLSLAITNTAELSVGARWADNMPAGAAYDEFVADTTKPQSRILFTTDSTVTKFKVLGLQLKEVDPQGKIIFTEEELYSQETLTPQRPLLVVLTFYGDLPHYGISYLDENGRAQKYSVQISGEDGTLILNDLG